ncbi:MAG: hypothetical protein CMJ76_10880 [Planctomycetaceae bacterium]|nr:hypothetical protein [Planctomycetaceae bacterium]
MVKSFILIILLTLGTVTHLFGQTTATSAVANTAEAEISLEELKLIGARESDFLTRDYQIPQSTTPKPRLTEFRNTILPILKHSCIGCHGEELTEGNIRIDTLDPNLQKGADVSWWIEVMAVLSNGEMPPPEEGELADKDRAKIIDWLSSEIQTASAVRRAEGGHSSFRRMTRYEYNYALQDILGLPWDFAKDLPPEAFSDDGFQNSSDLLHMTSNQFQTYREIARAALLRSTSLGEQPKMLHWGVSMKENAQLDLKKQQDQIDKKREEFKAEPARQKIELEQLLQSFQNIPSGVHYKNLRTGRAARASWVYYGGRHANPPQNGLPPFPATYEDVVVIPRGQNVYVELGDRIPDEGTMRVRVRAYTTAINESGPPSLQLEFGWRASNEGRAVLRVSDKDQRVTATSDNPQIYEFTFPLGEIYPRNSVRGINQMGQTPNPSEYIRLVNSSVSQSNIVVDFVQVSTPVYSTWPTASHERIFLQSEQRHDDPAYAREILANFMPKAWRRSITKEELDRKVRLFTLIRPECETLEEAVIEVLATILSSPNMLYITRSASSGNTFAQNSLTDYELATRLAMFVWCSTPDPLLLELASKRELRKPEILHEQMIRMLQDPRAQRLSKHFVHQWLDLKILEFLTIDRKTRPQLDAVLKQAMLNEPIAFFHETLVNNESVLNFIHADYTMVNERLATHYGLPNIYGNEFRRVNLAANSDRGGVLTQAGLLTMNTSGNDSHPLKRGIWLLESILNDPPPPPPPAVPEIDLADPEIAKMTLKERIEDHRNHAACKSCHSKIDPWGIAFENYDALGRWRTEVGGKPIDASSELFNKQQLNGMDGLKRFLLQNRQDQFTRAMVYKLTTFALGRPLTFGDHSSIDRITAEVRKKGDGLATMITLIVASDLFRSK